MSLTTEAVNERKWMRFPTLAALLSSKQLGVEWTGSTSASDNIFREVERLLEIHALVSDNEVEIRSLISSQIGNPLRDDLMRLSEALNWVSQKFAHASEETIQLTHTD